MTLQKVSQIFTKIAFKALHTKLIHIVLSVILLTIVNSIGFSQEFKVNDTLKLNSTMLEKPINGKTNDSTKKKKNALEGIVKMNAKDYEKIDQKKKQLTLYNEASIKYTDFDIKAGIIVYDFEKKQVYAGRIKDTAGNYTQRPVFTQGTNVVEPDSLVYNNSTGKALIWNSRTKQGEMNIKAEIAKRENDSVVFMKSARITTAKDIDDPEYYFYVTKVKFVPKKKVVVGPTNLVIADVPTPLFLPFAYFPMSENSTI